MSQYILQNKQERSATKDCLLVTNPGIIKEIYTVKELKNQSSNKEYIDFNVGEFITSIFLHDFIGGLCSIDEQTRHVVGNGIIGLIPSVNADKSTIGRILIDLNEIIISGTINNVTDNNNDYIKFGLTTLKYDKRKV